MTAVNSRHALILAVPENSIDKKLNLPVVRSDAELLARALRESRYDVTIRGTSDPAQMSRNQIGRAIREACESVPEDGVLLIFFSGHGVHSNGRDYLLPWDSDLRGNFDDTWFKVGSVSEWADESKAHQIVFFIDACREGIEQEIKAKAIGIQNWGTEKRRHAKKRYSIVFSCEPGEYSHYIPRFSLFSRALSQVLSIDHPARTLDEVIAATDQLLAKLIRDHDKSKQKITHRIESDQRAKPGEGVICDGHSEAELGASVGHWAGAVRRSILWRGVDDGTRDSKRIDAYRSMAESFAAAAEQRCRQATQDLGPDPWHDANYAMRTISRIEELTAAGGVFKLTPPEVALLLIAPFAREHAYASAISAFVPAHPKDTEVAVGSLESTTAKYRRRLEVTFRSYPQPLRRVRRLRANVEMSETKEKAKGSGVARLLQPRSDTRKAKRDAEDADIIMLWLLHRQIAKFAAMWHVAPDGTLALESVSAPVAATAEEQNHIREASKALSVERILKLAKCVRCEPDRLTRRDRHPLEPKVGLEGSRDELIRERLLASILCLAGWMALDVRAANETVVDHIGIGDPLDPKQFVDAAASAKWTTVGRVHELEVECRHPAIDYALRDLVNEANRILTEVTRIIVEIEGLPEVAKDLPGQLSPGGIAPVSENGRPAYTTPHRQFTLAQTEVRELLMGDQLYGNPDLAIRELYQNALDACRYRQARLKFLAQKGDRSDWKGKIVFRQGIDRGREYVECEDNGIGMGPGEIESCFSRAGKRFSDLPEFIEEQETWLQCDPKIEMTPNSQFGIGVLSYFMIADEIEVTTCRLDANGHPGDPLSIRIPGGGTLFRIQPATRMKDAGTRVRLYLREDWKKSCCSILEELLFIAEFETEARDGKQHLVWHAGKPFRANRYTPTDDPDFWWTDDVDAGQVLADGIATKLPDNVEPGVKGQPFGALVNLKNERQPKLTVDRTKILDFDAVWMRSKYPENAKKLSTMPWLRFSWLWKLPYRMQLEMGPQLINADIHIPLGYLDEMDEHNIWGTERSEWEQNLPQLRTLGFPMQVVGLDYRDRNVVLGLVRALQPETVSSPKESLRVLRAISSSYYLGVHDVTDAAAEATLERLAQDAGFLAEPTLQRAAIYIKLGFPAADWLAPYLPSVDLEEMSAARKLEEALKVREVKKEPPPKPKSIWKRIGDSIDKFLNRLPNWLAGTLVVGTVVILGHFAIEFLIWGAKLAWSYFW
jgi:hypothetical protein